MLLGAWLFLSPNVLMKKRTRLKEEWQKNRGAILAVGVLAFFTYLLILFALQMAKVSYVAAIRESSILFTTLYGTLWLRERYGRQKFLGTILIFLGVVFIGLSK